MTRRRRPDARAVAPRTTGARPGCVSIDEWAERKLAQARAEIDAEKAAVRAARPKRPRKQLLPTFLAQLLGRWRRPD